jgi:hypothetical protein
MWVNRTAFLLADFFFGESKKKSVARQGETRARAPRSQSTKASLGNHRKKKNGARRRRQYFYLS